MKGAGRRRHRVYICEVTTTKNAAKENVRAISEGVPHACEIRWLIGKELEVASRQSNETPLEVRFDYSPGLVSNKSVLQNKDESPVETYDVESVWRDRKTREIVARCVLRD